MRALPKHSGCFLCHSDAFPVPSPHARIRPAALVFLMRTQHGAQVDGAVDGHGVGILDFSHSLNGMNTAPRLSASPRFVGRTS